MAAGEQAPERKPEQESAGHPSLRGHPPEPAQLGSYHVSEHVVRAEILVRGAETEGRERRLQGEAAEASLSHRRPAIVGSIESLEGLPQAASDLVELARSRVIAWLPGVGRFRDPGRLGRREAASQVLLHRADAPLVLR